MGTNYNVIVRRGPFKDKMSAAKYAGEAAQHDSSTVISVAIEPAAGRVPEGTNPLTFDPPSHWYARGE